MNNIDQAMIPESPRWKEVGKKAKELTDEYNSPPIPVKEIAEDNGVNVVFADFGALSEKVSGYCDFEARKIVVNQADGLGRKMFTIAHELGHWLLHRELFLADKTRYGVLPRFHEPKQNVLEIEASVFAADLLVPRRLLVPVSDASPSRLADLFQVSKKMMENRINSLQRR